MKTKTADQPFPVHDPEKDEEFCHLRALYKGKNTGFTRCGLPTSEIIIQRHPKPLRVYNPGEVIPPFCAECGLRHCPACREAHHKL